MQRILTLLRPKKIFTVVCVVLSVGVFTVNLWVAVTPADAAVGINKTINFQGKLVDNNGLNVANGSYTVIFAIYDDPSLGTNSSCGAAQHCKWSETDTVTVSNGDGIFQVQLGNNTPLPGNVDFNTDSIYLGIQVNSDLEMTPRIQFTAVPYAFNAQKVNGLTVQNASGNPLTGAVLQIADNKTVQFGGAFNSGSNDLTFTTTAGTTVTFPGSGAITLVDQATSQVLTNKSIGSTGLTFTGASTDVTTNTNEDFTVSPNGSGDTILVSDADTGVYIGSASNTAAPLSVSGGIGSNASFIVNNLNSGDLIAASASGANKFRVANNGDLFLSGGISAGGTVGSNTQCLLGGSTVSWGACGNPNNYLRINQGTFSLVNDTADFLYGSNSTASAVFKLSVNKTSPVASVAGSTSYAAMVVNNNGLGDIFAASKSGATKFVIQNDGQITFDTANYTSCGYLSTDANAQMNCNKAISGYGDQLLGVYTITASSGATLHVTFNGAVDSTPSSASGTITFPSNTSKIYVEMKGGGGGGGGVGTNAVIKGAGGGGEGSFSKKYISSLANDYYLKIGGGGAGGNTAGSNGAQGTASCLGTNASDACSGPIMAAYGGMGGVGANAATPFAGGSGGFATGGDINTNGQPGFSGNALTSAAWGGAGGGISGAPATIASGNGGFGSNGGGGAGGADITAVATARVGGNGGTGYMLIYLYKNTSTGTGGADGWYQYNTGVLAPVNLTSDVLIGAIATSSAKVGFLNIANGTPIASLSAGAGVGAYFTAAGSFQTTDRDTLTVGGSTTGDIAFAPGGAQALYLASNGQVSLMNSAYANCGLLTTISNVIACNPASLRLVNGAYSFGNDTADFLFGGVATSSAEFKLSGSGTQPVASISARTSYAASVIDQAGTGDIFAASRSGATKFVITNSGTLVAGPDAAGTIANNLVLPGTLAHFSGNVNSYAQLNIQNRSNGANASSDFVATTDDGNDSINYIDFGINNSGYNNPSYTIGHPHDGYLYTNGGDLAIGTQSTGNVLQFHTSGTLAANERMRIDGNGNIGVNTTNPLAVLDVRGAGTSILSATIPVASVSGATNFAAMVVNNTGTGDLLTASKSGSTKFVITNGGTLVAGPDAAGTIANNLVLPGTLAHFSGNFNSYAQVNVQNRSNGANASSDFIATSDNGTDSVNYIDFGINSSAYNNASYTIGHANDGYLYTNGGDLAIGTQTTGKMLQFHTGGTLAANERMRIDDNGRVSINTTNPLAVLDVRGVGTSTLASTIPVASISGSTTFATMVVNNNGTGDLFTASKSGATKFVIANNGAVGIGTGNPTLATGLQVSAVGTTQVADLANFSNTAGQEPTATGINALQLTWNAKPAVNSLIGAGRANIINNNTGTGGTAIGFAINATGTGGAINSATDGLYIYGLTNASTGTTMQNAIQVGSNWDSTLFGEGDLRINANGNIVLATSSASTKVGIGTATPLATLDVRGKNSTQPVASVSGSTNFAAMVVNNTGTGDLLTASKSGSTKFVITNGGTLVAGPDAAGTIANNLVLPGTLAHFSGNFNSYAQINAQNRSNGNNASTDYIATADNGNDSVNYIDFGINSSTYNNSAYSIGGANDAYLYVNGGDLDIGTQTVGKMIQFHTGGTLLSNERMRIDDNGLVSINTQAPQAVLDVRGVGTQTLSGTIPVASISGKTAFASLVVNNTGTGDLIAASTAGLTRFVVKGNGNVLFGGDTISASSAGATNNGSPALINGLGDTGSLIPNSSFEAASGVGFSDGWTVAASSAASVVTLDTANSAHGNNSAKVTITNTSTAFYSTCIPVSQVTNNYNLGYFYRVTGNPIPTVRAVVDQYTTKIGCTNNQGTASSTPVGAAITANAAFQVQAPAAVTLLASTRWARIHFIVACTIGCTNATVNIDGVKFVNNSVTAGLDYAENYPADETNMPEPGDVVSLQAVGKASQVTKASHYMDNSVIGVVSTQPGELLDDGSMGDAKVAVALAGRIPTKVSTQNGPIHIGDYLTSSEIPGVAVKAISAGPVIGQAMEEYDETDPVKIGTVVTFVKNTYYNGIPLTLSSGLVSDTQQGDLAFLGTLIDTSTKLASTSSKITTVSADKIIAGLSIVAPRITTETLQVNTIKASKDKDINVQLSDNGQFIIKDASGNATVVFDNKGNAVFNGIVTANKIRVNQIEGLSVLETGLHQQEIAMASLSALFAKKSVIQTLPDDNATSHEASIAALLAKYDSNILSLQALNVSQNTKIGGNLRVQGNSLIEGILNVVDMLTANNLLVNKVADFFGSVIFHSDVTFQGRPTFNNDTAGTAVIRKDSDKVIVTFRDEYKDTPVVSATQVVSQITKSPNQSSIDQENAQKDIEEKMLDSSVRFIVTRVSTKGFVIILNKPATDDMTFSWTALAVSQQHEAVSSNVPSPTNPVPTPDAKKDEENPSSTPELQTNQHVKEGGDAE